MAILRFEDGTTYTAFSDITRKLAPLNVQLNHWPTGDNPQLQSLLAQEILNEKEKEQVLTSLDGYFEELKSTAGYQSREFAVLYPGSPDVELLSRFDKIHTHADDEGAYIIDGEGIFGFVKPDGTQMELTVQAGEYINMPANTEHWFYMIPPHRIKAICYFSGTESWVPHYTGREIRFPQAVV
jgi:1,2-dihydroxy-3-keto-5-methylthiopentene dioxygenase